MMFRSVVLLVVLLTVAIESLPAVAMDDKSSVLRVMSFNIRYGTAADGENHWDLRKEFVIETIKAFDPDLLGTQETLKFQRDYLAAHLPEYEVLGVGRDDGRDGGEMMALYFKKDRFRKLESGHFWLSESPEIAGSKSWDTSLPRMVTWVKLTDLRESDAVPIMYFNTHFDHRGSAARRQSSLLIRGRAQEAAKECRIVVTGDFNAGAGSDPWKAMFDDAENVASPVVDSFRVHHPKVEPNEGTFSGFKSTETGGDRIDWIAVSRDWKILEANIDHTEKDGRTPSDHFPVTAILEGLR